VSYLDLNVVQIDLTAIAHNMAQLKGCLRKPTTGLMPVVKSDGYGHGMCEVARVAAKNGATALAVFDIKEAVLLRQAGFNVPILLISGILPEDSDIAVAYGLTVGVTDIAILNVLESACNGLDKTVRIHLKIDTGMSRMGLSETELSYILQRIHMWRHLEFEGIYSHIACADCVEHSLNEIQLRRFSQAREMFIAHLGRTPFSHMANAAAATLIPDTQFDAIRPGIAVYGGYPSQQQYLHSVLDLKPAMSYYSRIIAIREVEAGVSVSYGARFAVTKPSRLAVVPVGYDCGYMRTMSGKAQVIVRGRRCQVAGTICMRSMMVDVTDIVNVSIGDKVTLLGGDQNDRITIEEMAGWAGTINYELLCLLGTRNRRIYKER